MHKLVGARGRLVATEHRRPLLGVAERSVAGRGLMRSAFAGSRTLREHRASEPAHRASSRNTSATGDEPAARTRAVALACFVSNLLDLISEQLRWQPHAYESAIS